MKRIKSVEVFYHDYKVGTLSEFKGVLTAFQYSQSWIRNGFSISPLSLPLSDKIYFSEYEPFNGLFGVFDDSLPDGWGMLLTDRMLRSNGIDPQSINSITRLSLLGENAKGALEYRPSQFDETMGSEGIDFDLLYEQCNAIYLGNDKIEYDHLYSMAGSSGGARPKAYISLDGEAWLIKFPSSGDSKGIGVQEFEYCRTARECGIRTVECRLLPSTKTEGFFACRRFDRNPSGSRVHMVSAGGLLETSYRFPMLDYSHLMKLTAYLTKDVNEVKNMFSLMCFNEVFHNRDDHAKNFSFLYDEKDSRWVMSPAYDLTYSSSVNGEHATTINGKGANPTGKDMVDVGVSAGLDEKWCTGLLSSIIRKAKE